MNVALSAADEATRARIAAALRAAGHAVVGRDEAADVVVADGLCGAEAAREAQQAVLGLGRVFIAGITDVPGGVAAALRGGAADAYPAGDAAALLTRLAVLEAAGPRDVGASLAAANVNDAMYAVDLEGRFLWANEAAERLTGYRREQLVGMHFSELVRDPGDIERAAAEMAAKVAGDTETSLFEVTITTASGELVPVEVNSRVVFRDGQPWAVEGVARDLRPRRRAEAEVRRQAELFAQLGVAAVAVDTQGRIVAWNREAERMFGEAAVSMLGTRAVSGFSTDVEATARQLARVLTGETVTEARDLRRADGSIFPALVTAAPLRDERGAVAGAIGVILDLSEERARQERMAQLAAVVESSDDAITMYDRDGTIIGWNAAAERIYGRPAAEAVGMKAWELAEPAEQEARRAMVLGVLGGEAISGQVVRRGGNPGMVGYLSLSAFPLRDAEGRITGAAAVARDITALVEAERERSRLAAIVESADDAVIGRDLEGRITSWNAAAERLFGYTAAEMLGGYGYETVPASRRGEYTARAREVAGEERVEADVLRQDRQGRVFPVRAVTFPVYDQRGQRLGSATFLRDISDERAMLAALEERERQLRALFESAGEAIILVDRERRIRWLNRAAVAIGEETFGERPDVGAPIDRWVRPQDREAWEAAFEGALAGRSTTLLGRLMRSDGSPFWYEMTYRPVHDADGSVAAAALVGRDVTERMEAERALRDREATLRSIFESTRDHLWLLDREGRLVTCNTPAAEFSERRFGRRPESGDSMLAFADERGRPVLEAAIRMALEGQEPEGELAVPHADGTKTYFNIHVTPVRDERRGITGVLVDARDVTAEALARRELQRARQALAEEYAKLSTIIENSDEGVILLDRECRVVAFNSEFAEGTKLRRGIAPQPGMHFTETVSPESAAFLLGKVQEALAGRRVAFEVQSQTPGQRRWFEVRIRPVVTESGEVTGAVYTGRDVTERRLLEEEREAALAEARRLAAIVESSTEAALAVGRDGRIESWNRAAEALYGWSAEEATGQPFTLIVPPEERPAAERLFARLLAGESYRGEMDRVHRSGQRFRVESVYFPLRDAQGVVIGVGCTSHDVTREREMERRIAESAADLAATLASIREGVALIGADGRLAAVNPATQSAVGEVFGVRPEPGMHWRDALPESWHQAFAEVMERTLAGESMTYELQLTDAAGNPRWFELSFGRVELPDGSVRGIALSTRDLTERKRTEERLLQAQKAESLAVLAGGIAHDFNNLLVGILGNAGLALAELPPESPVRETVAEIELAGQRAADLARQMLAYSGRGKFVVQPLSLNGVVEEMAHLLRVSVGAGVRLVLDLAPGLPAVVGDATQLRQVIMNLVINASDAIGSGEGTIRVRTSVAPGTRELFERAVLAPGQLAERYVVLEVADTGAGMDAATLSRIFDPFFTTKFTGRGLGLAAVLGIIRGHRGGIDVESAPGAGTTFRVMLPASQSTAQAEPGAGSSGQWRGEGLVIVADDEPSVRAVTSRALRAMGFEVAEAADGQEAVEVYARERGRVRLVLLDMTMPRMSGEAALRAIRELDPGAKVVLMSGYTEQDAQEQVGGGLAGFLQKPYELGALRETVRRALGEDTG
ncbi:PAS domain S-box protein [Tepidiforma sp.]|uniref:PAS domain S-box protein n=1 Tax=Tepidiforma sp. TaxID=2682230 RepID=UPI0026023FAB|nr:PAS domain S-box protein [Tepidiforma sp.]MCX7616691.1 PAS domain S-box protein [Tepidiforma sp.]